jgi:hypothetical protein
MGRGIGLIGLIVVVAVGLYFYSSQLGSIVPDGQAPATAISVTGVRNDLLAMANSERRYLASHPRYASLDELRTDGDIHIPTRPDFNYSIDAGLDHFTITATYTGTDPKAPHHITIDDAMSISSECCFSEPGNRTNA